MKNRKYWEESLGNALPKQLLSEKEIDDIMAISEMEYEYTEHQAHIPSKEEINPTQNKLFELESKIRIYEDYISKLKKVDSVTIEKGEVKFYSKLP